MKDFISFLICTVVYALVNLFLFPIDFLSCIFGALLVAVPFLVDHFWERLK